MYKVGDVINCTVCGVENYGIFIRTDDNYTGLIHISEISSDFVRNVSDYAKVGEKIKCQILEVDDELRQLKLTINEMLSKLSQGTGRLIRSSSDRGIVCILDSRMPVYLNSIQNTLPFKNYTTDIDVVKSFSDEVILGKRHVLK